jgi:NADPH-dependent glutamate synthase beta subunit-like oxidoreductase
MNRSSQHSVRIDGREVQLPCRSSLLAEALAAGIYIPHLCSHPDLPPARRLQPVAAVFRAGERVAADGSWSDGGPGCGLCVVEVEGAGEPQCACELEAAPGMAVSTDTQALRSLRQEKLARILARHPHACLTCAQKEGCSREPCSSSVPVAERCCSLLGRCELEKLAAHVGISPGTPRYVPRGLPPEDIGGLFASAPELCVGCLRCVRACTDLKGVGALGFVVREGAHVVGRLADTSAESGCRFCGACVEVCPTGALTDRGPATGEREERLVPCRSRCPAGVDVPRFLRAIARGRLEEAARVSRDRLPLPRVLGYVCFPACEDGCRRSELGGRISVRRLRRTVFENAAFTATAWPEPARAGRQVAVIGSGPAGLSAAQFLLRMGHRVTIFEAAPEAGGLLRHGIPAYRLPREVLQQDLADIAAAGVEIRTSMALGRDFDLESLRSDGFAAVLLAAGAGAAKPLELPGSDLDGIQSGVAFLQQTACGSFAARTLAGRSVLVIGGGNVAVDAARTALRCGASGVAVACLEAAEQMPAHRSEIEAARAEGVEFHAAWGPVAFLGGNGSVRGVRFVRCTSVFDASGRFAPRFDENVTREVPAQAVIVAIGQEADAALRSHPGLEFRENGALRAGASDCRTGIEGVFACGDLVLGPSSVVRAVASGRLAAECIDRFLGGTGEVPSILEPETPPQWIGPRPGFAAAARLDPVEVPAARRIACFGSIEATLPPAAAESEAGRCLQCDLRLRLSPPVLPPLHWRPLTEREVAKVPGVAGVYQLLGPDRIPLKIAGTADLARALRGELQSGSAAPCFIFDVDPMYTKRESELLQQFLALHGRMPGGQDGLDELF